ncbi:MAG: hypothetical protein GY898_18145 [Proteobacteria bacterium]|nr:hypothetical protein [Pseudomonadota bacterium]
MSQARLEAMFRAAAEELDPGGNAPVTPSRVRAQLIVHAIRGQRRWLDAALAGLDAGRARTAEDPIGWLEAACHGWVSRADRSLRTMAEDLIGTLPANVSTVPARLLYWRTTGLRRVLDGALELSPTEVAAGDSVGGAAAWAAYLATADEAYADTARAGLGGPLADIAAERWHAAADALDLEPTDVPDEAVDALEQAEAGARLIAAAALVAPIVRLEVEWFMASELREGPMAEAATFPWPAVRFSFKRMPDLNQIRIHPTLAGEPMMTIEDLGVVAAGLDLIVAEADRSALMEGMGRRRKKSLLRKR